MRGLLLLVLWLALSGLSLSPADASPEVPQSPGPSPTDTPAPREADAAWAAWQALAPEIQAKVDGRILAELRGEVSPAYLNSSVHLNKSVKPRLGEKSLPTLPHQQTRFLVYMRESADTPRLDESVYASQADRRSALVASLRATAQRSQASVRQLLVERSATRQGASPSVAGFQPFFIVNALAVEGDIASVTALAQRDDVARIVANYPLVPLRPVPEVEAAGQSEAARPDTDDQSRATSLYYWNLKLVEADRVHTELGIRGAGAVVGGFDTGVNYKHPALVNQYRGNENGVFNHNYNWFVPDGTLYPNGNLGPSATDTPADCDYSTHGTHTMGTMVGGTGGSNGPTVGMAPDARWIAVPGICGSTMPGGVRDDIGGIKAFQWFLCPTDLTGDLSTADCSKAPDAINNSWGSANPIDDTFRPILQVLRRAGIAPVFAAGNPSAGPGSIGTPGNAPEAITVGATTEYDSLAYFSAQGPSIYPGEQKPELTAPGSYVRSSVDSSGYDEYSGTSMAAPHVAGLIALLVSADLQDGVRDFNVDELEQLMTLSAVDLGDPGPDNFFGYGRIDAYAAVQLGLTAGDLQGQILDAEYKTPVPGIQIVAYQPASERHFSARADASGLYSLTVPAGEYEVTLSGWGYETTAVGTHRVIAGALSLTDFALLSKPRATVTGVVADAQGPVANALVYAKGNPAVQTRTASDGRYALSLPLGPDELVVEAHKHKIARQPVQTPGVGAVVNFVLKSAPSILLVDTSSLDGFFQGWPVHGFFTRGLDAENYQYLLWRIQYNSFFDTKAGPDGSTLYGLPSAATLKRYDVVIWIQSYCANDTCNQGSPGEIGAEPALIEFLDGGGRLLISGQDLAYADRESKLLNAYLQAAYVRDRGGSVGTALAASDFLSGLKLELMNGSLYGYNNGVLPFTPDAVIPRPGGFAFPILRYGESEQAAALAVAPCNASYRAVYLAAGLENLVPRADQTQPDWTRLLDASLAWLMGGKKPDTFYLSSEAAGGTGEAGANLSYSLSLSNLSSQPLRLAVQTQGNQWPTRLTFQGAPLPSTLELPPCSSNLVDVAVDIPYDSQLGAVDSVTVTVASLNLPVPNQQLTFETRQMTQWRAAEPLPATRYGQSTVAAAQGYRVIGGVTDARTDKAIAEHLWFDPCVGRWEPRAPLPVELSFAASAAIGDRVYVAGGVDLGAENDGPRDTLYIYDTKTDVWSLGAPMPRSLYFASGAAAGGKFYVFGGFDGLSISDGFLVYDPSTNQWQDMGEMAGGQQALGAVAVFNDGIYLTGGLPDSDSAVRYSPSTNSWTSIRSPLRGRVGAQMAAAPDGYIYLIGGDGGGDLVERYNTATGIWSTVNATLGDDQDFMGAVYLEGSLYLAGGLLSDISHETLRLSGSFCESGLINQQTAVGPDGLIVYTVELHSTEQDQPNVRLVAPLHPNQSFAGFPVPSLPGATWTEAHAVEWSGSLPANAPPVRFSYATTLNAGVWQPGDRITHTVAMNNGRDRTLTRQVVSQFFLPDFSASAKLVSSPSVKAGDPFTYTIDLHSRTPVGGQASFTDPLPAMLKLVADSVQQNTGVSSYDPGSHTLRWSGPAGVSRPGFVNLSGDYLWADNLGGGTTVSAAFTWQDIRKTGKLVVLDTNQAVCNQQLGFDFPFYGTSYQTACVDVNGQITLGDNGSASNADNRCPLPNGDYYYARIAGLWSSLAVDDGVYMQTFGEAPDRYTVFQWADARFYDEWYEFFGITFPPDTDFQIVLHESGQIQVYILRLGEAVRGSSTTGLVSRETGQSITYQCNGNVRALGAGASVSFLPPGDVLNSPSEKISFQMRVKEDTPVNSRITNTVAIQSQGTTYTRTAELLAQSVDLTASAKQASRGELLPGASVAYTITLSNRGQVLARNATLADRLPTGLVYENGSLACSRAGCGESGGLITWQGDLLPGDGMTVTYRAELDAVLADRTPLTNTVRIDAAGVAALDRSAVVYARSTNLSASVVDFGTAPREPGDRFPVTVLLRNTGLQGVGVDMNLPLPSELGFVPDTLRCGIGQCRTEGGRILWSGTLPPRGLVAVQFDVRLAQGLAAGHPIRVQGELVEHIYGQKHPLIGQMFAAFHHYFPLMIDNRIPPLFAPLVANNSAEPGWVVWATPMDVPTVPAGDFTPVPASPLPTPESAPFPVSPLPAPPGG
ncbi:MAG: S8 family serine peptidase [Caldilineaceae bacterium]